MRGRGRGDVWEQLLQEVGQELLDPLPGHLPQPLRIGIPVSIMDTRQVFNDITWHFGIFMSHVMSVKTCPVSMILTGMPTSFQNLRTNLGFACPR